MLFIYLLLNVLQGVITFFAGSNLNDVLDVIDEDLSIANVAGIKDTLGRIDDIPDRDFAINSINLHFWD